MWHSWNNPRVVYLEQEAWGDAVRVVPNDSVPYLRLGVVSRQTTQAAMAWLLARSPVIPPIPGTSSMAHSRRTSRLRRCASRRSSPSESEEAREYPGIWQSFSLTRRKRPVRTSTATLARVRARRSHDVHRANRRAGLTCHRGPGRAGGWSSRISAAVAARRFRTPGTWARRRAEESPPASARSPGLGVPDAVLSPGANVRWTA